ncbi:MAG: serine hydrolase domain-containing protein [Pseudomonadota bacterium]|nr:serine hydrolase domain-containing protein [Pseudomonadota bacterium]
MAEFSMNVTVEGNVSDGFERVADVFADLWKDIEVGASCCVFHEGEKVIDIWGGYINREMTIPWESDTLINVYSTTKGMASLALAVLFDEGLIDYNEKVTTYWPEFGAEGKQNITVAQLLSHQAGLCGVDQKLVVEDLYDFPKMANLLAAQKPFWEPGTDVGYHAITWGYFPGELIRRITGRSLGSYFHEKVSGPLEADFFIGIPETEIRRCGVLIGPNRARTNVNISEPSTGAKFYSSALLNPSIAPYRHASSNDWRRAEIAAANGQANARGIATIYGALANQGCLDGTHIISSEAIAAATKIEVDGKIDNVLGTRVRRARGFMLNHEKAYGPYEGSFGHGGAGGSLGFADPLNKVGFGYAMNQMQAGSSVKPRSLKLVNSFYQCIGQ